MTEVPTPVPASPFVRLVVLTYEAGELLDRCVTSLLALDWPADRREIVVIDNDSSDGSIERLEAARHPGVRIVRNPRGNSGFSANNLAFTDLEGVDHVGLVNPDSTVDPAWLRHLAGTLAAEPNLGAACPRILLDELFTEVLVPPGPELVVTGARVGGVAASFHVAGGVPLPGLEGALWLAPSGSSVRVAAPEGLPSVELELAAARRHRRAFAGAEPEIGTEPAWTPLAVGPARVEVLQSAGCYRLPDGNAGDIGWLTRDGDRWSRPADVDGWCGASVLLSARYLAEVGGFDESFFLYYEDADLSWRGARKGWRYRYVPEAVARHHQSATIGVASPLGIHHQWRNRLRMVRNNGGRLAALRTSARMALSLARSVFHATTDRPAVRRHAQRRVLRSRIAAVSPARRR